MNIKTKHINLFLLTTFLLPWVLLLGCGTSKTMVSEESILKYLNDSIAPTVKIKFNGDKGYLWYRGKLYFPPKSFAADNPRYSKTFIGKITEETQSNSVASRFKYMPEAKTLLLEIFFDEKEKTFNIVETGCYTPPAKEQLKQKWREPKKIEICFDLSESGQQTEITFRDLQMVKTTKEKDEKAAPLSYQESKDALLLQNLKGIFKSEQLDKALADEMNNYSKHNETKKSEVGGN